MRRYNGRTGPCSLAYSVGDVQVRLIPGTLRRHSERLQAVRDIHEGENEEVILTRYAFLMAFVLWDDPNLTWDLQADPDEVDRLVGDPLKAAIDAIIAECETPSLRRVLDPSLLVRAVFFAAMGVRPDRASALMSGASEEVAQAGESSPPSGGSISN